MANYFKYFPKLNYQGEVLRDITTRPKFLDDLAQDPYAFMPYTIKDGETAQEVSYLYYGNPTYVWIIYVANDMVDPYFDWPISDQEVTKTIAKKYKEQAEASDGVDLTPNEVIEWSLRTEKNGSLFTDNILYYYDNEGTKITVDTYLYGGVNTNDWSPMRVYEYEIEMNESKRDIKLLNKEYLNIAMANLKNSMKGSRL
jgi:hypothetical protein